MKSAFVRPTWWCNPGSIDSGARIHAALADLEASPPQWGAHPDYGHLTLACALGYLDLRQPGSWRDKYPKLVAWLDQFATAVPGFDATKPVG